MGAKPRRQVLRRTGLGIRVVGGTPDPDKQGGRRSRTGLGIDQRQAVGKIDEWLLAVAVGVSKTDILLSAPPMIVGHKLRVLIAVQMLRLVLTPEQIQGQIEAAMLTEFRVDR